jgi:hypothetical protein
VLTLVELGTGVHLGPVRRQVLQDAGRRVDTCWRCAHGLALPLAHGELMVSWPREKREVKTVVPPKVGHWSGSAAPAIFNMSLNQTELQVLKSESLLNNVLHARDLAAKPQLTQ